MLQPSLKPGKYVFIFIFVNPNPTFQHVVFPVSKLIVPDGGVHLTPAWGCRIPARQPLQPGGRYDNPPYARVDFILPVRDYEFGYRSGSGQTGLRFLTQSLF